MAQSPARLPFFRADEARARPKAAQTLCPAAGGGFSGRDMELLQRRKKVQET